MGKHAYLIMDNGKNFHQLQFLIKALDDVRNDIFIHIDKKSSKNVPAFKTQKSRLYLIEPRIPVYWGGLSIVQCEFLLFEKSFKKGPYEYYHLMSGQDLPIQTQDYIHDFFDKNRGKEFVSFDFKRTKNDKMIRNRFEHYHLNANYSFRSSKNALSSIFIRGYRIIENKVQDILNINREKQEKIHYYYGSQWVSIDNDLISHILKNRANILQLLKYTNISDELFMQTVVWNNPTFKNRVYCNDNYLISNLRYINWNWGLPYTWENTHYDLLENAMSKGFLFSRKFDLLKNETVISKVLKHDGVD